jgi:hypothetical protein
MPFGYAPPTPPTIQVLTYGKLRRPIAAMDRAALQQLLREAETRLYREEQDIARQHEIIALLKQRGQDASAAKTVLRRLESRQARHIAERNRLFRQLAELT